MQSARCSDVCPVLDNVLSRRVSASHTPEWELALHVILLFLYARYDKTQVVPIYTAAVLMQDVEI